MDEREPSLLAVLALCLAILAAVKGVTMWPYGLVGVLPYTALAAALGSLSLTAYLQKRR